MAGVKGELRKETKKSSQKQREHRGEIELKEPVYFGGVSRKEARLDERRVQSTELESVNVTSVEKIVFDKMERYRAVFMKLMKTF